MKRARQIDQLAGMLSRHVPAAGRVATCIEGMTLFRADEPSPIRCMIYHPCVIIVAQGEKRAQLGDAMFDYSPARYLVLPVSLPIAAQVREATPARPFLSFAIDVDPATLGEIVSKADLGTPGPREAVRGIAVSETTPELLDAAVRLVSCLDSRADARVLGPQIKREILYRILCGPQGDLLRGVGGAQARLGQVSRALRFIHANFHRPLDVADLAREAHMSASTFYQAFKAVTSLSPLQYIKEVRLSRARQHIVWGGTSVTTAAEDVGYASTSQFSREFKRRFGRSPRDERTWAIETGELREPRPF
jgi:AraC-like DNA-binding protein